MENASDNHSLSGDWQGLSCAFLGFVQRFCSGQGSIVYWLGDFVEYESLLPGPVVATQTCIGRILGQYLNKQHDLRISVQQLLSKSSLHRLFPALNLDAIDQTEFVLDTRESFNILPSSVVASFAVSSVKTDAAGDGDVRFARFQLSFDPDPDSPHFEKIGMLFQFLFLVFFPTVLLLCFLQKSTSPQCWLITDSSGQLVMESG